MNAFIQLSLNEFRQSKVLLPYYNVTKSAFYKENVYGLRERLRKPPWLPIAKTKMYKIAPIPVIPKDDSEEIKRLHNIYRTQYRTIINFLQKELEEERKSLLDVTSEASIKEELSEYERCMKENDHWNDQIALERAERFKKKYEDQKREILQKKKEMLEQNERLIREAEEQIEEWKNVKFIPREEIDAAIEKAINSTVDYNYAIDTEGNIYHGRDGGPDLQEEMKSSN